MQTILIAGVPNILSCQWFAVLVTGTSIQIGYTTSVAAVFPECKSKSLVSLPLNSPDMNPIKHFHQVPSGKPNSGSYATNLACVGIVGSTNVYLIPDISDYILVPSVGSPSVGCFKSKKWSYFTYKNKGL
ncbi:hypothetical protein TNCV_2528061 [Trichonephila clavipes]|nr:hypothetical protein TNCV_2528061 [Trichonephila clavipes]